MATYKQYDHGSNSQFTITSSATLVAYIRVKIDSNGELAAAGATDGAIGYLTERGATANEPATVRSTNAPSFTAVASKAIAVGDACYGAASGKITDTQGTTEPFIGYALTAAANDGDTLLVIAGDAAV